MELTKEQIASIVAKLKGNLVKGKDDKRKSFREDDSANQARSQFQALLQIAANPEYHETLNSNLENIFQIITSLPPNDQGSCVELITSVWPVEIIDQLIGKLIEIEANAFDPATFMRGNTLLTKLLAAKRQYLGKDFFENNIQSHIDKIYNLVETEFKSKASNTKEWITSETFNKTLKDTFLDYIKILLKTDAPDFVKNDCHLIYSNLERKKISNINSKIAGYVFLRFISGLINDYLELTKTASSDLTVFCKSTTLKVLQQPLITLTNRMGTDNLAETQRKNISQETKGQDKTVETTKTEKSNDWTTWQVQTQKELEKFEKDITNYLKKISLPLVSNTNNNRDLRTDNKSFSKSEKRKSFASLRKKLSFNTLSGPLPLCGNTKSLKKKPEEMLKLAATLIGDDSFFTKEKISGKEEMTDKELMITLKEKDPTSIKKESETPLIPFHEKIEDEVRPKRGRFSKILSFVLPDSSNSAEMQISFSKRSTRHSVPNFPLHHSDSSAPVATSLSIPSSSPSNSPQHSPSNSPKDLASSTSYINDQLKLDDTEELTDTNSISFSNIPDDTIEQEILAQIDEITNAIKIKYFKNPLQRKEFNNFLRKTREKLEKSDKDYYKNTLEIKYLKDSAREITEKLEKLGKIHSKNASERNSLNSSLIKTKEQLKKTEDTLKIIFKKISADELITSYNANPVATDLLKLTFVIFPSKVIEYAVAENNKTGPLPSNSLIIHAIIKDLFQEKIFTLETTEKIKKLEADLKTESKESVVTSLSTKKIKPEHKEDSTANNIQKRESAYVDFSGEENSKPSKR